MPVVELDGLTDSVGSTAVDAFHIDVIPRTSFGQATVEFPTWRFLRERHKTWRRLQSGGAYGLGASASGLYIPYLANAYSHGPSSIAANNPRSLYGAALGSYARPLWLNRTLAQLRDLATLATGWDTYAGRPIGRGLLYDALRFLLRQLNNDSPAPSMVPTSDGGVLLEWHRAGVDVEVSFSDGEMPELYFLDIAT